MSIFLIKICLFLFLFIGTMLFKDGNCEVNCRKFPFHSDCRGVWAFSKRKNDHLIHKDLSYENIGEKLKPVDYHSEDFDELNPKFMRLILQYISRTLHEDQI